MVPRQGYLTSVATQAWPYFQASGPPSPYLHGMHAADTMPWLRWHDARWMLMTFPCLETVMLTTTGICNTADSKALLYVTTGMRSLCSMYCRTCRGTIRGYVPGSTSNSSLCEGENDGHQIYLHHLLSVPMLRLPSLITGTCPSGFCLTSSPRWSGRAQAVCPGSSRSTTPASRTHCWGGPMDSPPTTSTSMR